MVELENPGGQAAASAAAPLGECMSTLRLTAQLGEVRVRNNECGWGWECLIVARGALWDDVTGHSRVGVRGRRVHHRDPLTVCITMIQSRALGKQKRVEGTNGFFISCRARENRFRDTRVRYVYVCTCIALC